MEEEKLHELRAMLLQRKQELQTIIINNEHILREQLAPVDGEENRIDFNHPADTIVGDPDYDKEINLIRRERAELALVSSALARMDQGHYGDCEECGEEIPYARLKAIPYAKYCIACREDKDAAVQLRQNLGDPEANPHDVSNLGV